MRRGSALVRGCRREFVGSVLVGLLCDATSIDVRYLVGLHWESVGVIALGCAGLILRMCRLGYVENVLVGLIGTFVDGISTDSLATLR